MGLDLSKVQSEVGTQGVVKTAVAGVKNFMSCARGKMVLRDVVKKMVLNKMRADGMRVTKAERRENSRTDARGRINSRGRF